ncbi:tRNA pseudouridine(13) synthase TruD [Pseudaeromonas paramecii]|uniref:tRNA pseudouridine synthase D n=2 Tax=Pseudaeromonas paramecii TaxID=2138166 RepID=A0ABP8Q7M6_9GAMM
MMIPKWHYLHGQPTQSARLKAEPADFQVFEDLGFEPDGTGEHLMVRIRKTGENTAWVAKLLAQAADVPRASITWAGLKDRHAVTEQWFGIHLPGKPDPDLSVIENEQIQILSMARHSRKMRVGALKGNHFQLLLRDLSVSDALESRLQAIAAQGVPNYFGSQRFGRNGNNLEGAQSMFDGRRIKDRDKRSIFLSAARSYLFNLVVSARLEAGLAQRLLAGDCLMLAGTHSFFAEEEASDALAERLAQGDLQLSAPLWGRGRSPALAEALAFETQALAGQESWQAGLEAAGLKQERRPLLLQPKGLQWQWAPEGLQLNFWLPAGTYATSLVRELVQVQAEQDEDTAE